MARRMVGDDQEVYRIIIVRRQQRDNPDWERGNPASPRFLWDGKEFETSYGPYNSLGAARGRLTRETTYPDGRTRNGVAGGRIEKADTTWTEVE